MIWIHLIAMDLEHFDSLLSNFPEIRPFYKGVISDFDSKIMVHEADTAAFWLLYSEGGASTSRSGSSAIGHLTCLFRSSRDEYYYFDSCATNNSEPPIRLRQQLEMHNLILSSNRRPFQSENTCLCSLFCLIFAYYSLHFDSGIRAIAYLFPPASSQNLGQNAQELRKNEIMVANWFDHKFSDFSRTAFHFKNLFKC